MDSKDNKLAVYANGFSFIVSKDSGEVVIAFTQNQPEFDGKTGQFEEVDGRTVETVVVPYSLAEQLCVSLQKALADEDAKTIYQN